MFRVQPRKRGVDEPSSIYAHFLGRIDKAAEEMAIAYLAAVRQSILESPVKVREQEVREKWAQAHRRIRDKLPPFTRRSLTEQREDILVTYADGPGKSGAYYAGLYAAVNEISAQRVVEPSLVTDAIDAVEEGSIRGVVVVDDMLGTGQNLVDKMM